MNQYLRDSILYLAPLGKPITELRQAGDNLVLYTEDSSALTKFRLWSQMLCLVPYTQDDKVVGADLYFPKSAKKQLLRALTDSL